VSLSLVGDDDHEQDCSDNNRKNNGTYNRYNKTHSLSITTHSLVYILSY